MNNIETLLSDIEIPKFHRANLIVDNFHIEDVEAAVKQCLERDGTLERIQKGQTVAVSAGSREISGIDKILKTLVDAIKERGAFPFIFPAMGSHGGATAKGQQDILAQYGITEERMGAPVLSSMKTVIVGHTAEGIPVHVDKYAMSADHIIPVGRIKPHTDFKGDFESGLMKMLAIGVGKQAGASICHKLGMEHMSKNVQAIGHAIIQNCSVPFGVGIIENAFHGTYSIHAIPGERIEMEEPELLLKAKALVPVIPFSKVDIVVCERMGKEISGTGMDSNVIGRSASLGISAPYAERIGVFELTEKSHGNGNGMGLADSVTQHFFETMEFEQTYPNAITSAETMAVKLPAVMPSDALCVKFLIKTCTHSGEHGIRMVWMKDTLSLNDFWVSDALFLEKERKEGLTIHAKTYQPSFDETGRFTEFKEDL